MELNDLERLFDERYFDRFLRPKIGSNKNAKFRGIELMSDERGYKNTSRNQIIKFNLLDRGVKSHFTVFFKTYLDLKRHEHRISHGATIDAYVEHVHYCLDTIGAGSFFVNYLDRIPELHAVLWEHLPLPTIGNKYREACAIERKAIDKFNRLRQSYLVFPQYIGDEIMSSLDKTKWLRTHLTLGALHFLADFYSKSKDRVKDLPPRQYVVYENGQQYNRNVNLFDGTDEKWNAERMAKHLRAISQTYRLFHVQDLQKTDDLGKKAKLEEAIEFIDNKSEAKIQEIVQRQSEIEKEHKTLNPLIVHGDFHLDNILVDFDENGFGFKFIDPKHVRIDYCFTDSILFSSYLGMLHTIYLPEIDYIQQMVSFDQGTLMLFKIKGLI